MDDIDADSQTQAHLCVACFSVNFMFYCLRKGKRSSSDSKKLLFSDEGKCFSKWSCFNVMIKEVKTGEESQFPLRLNQFKYTLELT